MLKEKTLPSDLIIEPLKLKHLSMLKASENAKYLGIFQILLIFIIFSCQLFSVLRPILKLGIDE